MNLLDVLSELLQLPPERRQARLDALRLSETDRADVESCLRSHEKAGGFLADPPALIGAAMQLLRGDAQAASTRLDSRTLSVLDAAAASFGRAADEPLVRPQVPGYEAAELLGQGGMASVWRAKQLATGRTVALKVMSLLQGSARARGRFERELRLMSRLQHPHIARVYDAGLSAGLCYFAMELVDGQPLDQFVRSQGLTHRQIAELMRVVCEAVTHAHRNGVIHRDLKPSNILADAAGQPHVLDFGLAKALEEAGPEITVSLDGDLAGTPAYMSPEQAAGSASLDTRTDVYSLGVILYRLLTGQPAHDLSGSRLEVLKRISTQEVRRPRDVCRQIDSDLEAVLLKALDREPDRRYGSAAELAQDLGRYLADEPVEAAPPSAAYRFRKLLRRHKREAAAVLAVAIALVLGVIGLTVGLVRAHRAQVAAQNQARKAEAVSRFMAGIIASARPDAGGNLNVADLLTRASEQLGPMLRDQPEAEVEARQTLGTTYYSHAAAAEAEAEYRRAYELSVQLDKGHVSERTLRLASRLALTWTWVTNGHGSRQVPLARNAYETARRTLGESHPASLFCGAALYIVLDNSNQPEEAERVVRKLLPYAVEQISVPEFYTSEFFDQGFLMKDQLLTGLVFVLHDEGKSPQEAIEPLQAALKRYQSEKNPEPIRITNVETYLGMALADVGRDEEAVEHFRLAAEDSRRLFGRAHKTAQAFLVNYAQVLRRTGHWDRAIALLNKNLEAARSTQSNDSTALATAMAAAGIMQVDRHQKSGIPLTMEGLAMVNRVGSYINFDTDGAPRAALLGSLGSWDCDSDGKLPAQVYCALDEMLRDNQSRLFDFTAATPAVVHYRLRRWQDSTATVAEGNL